MRQSSIQIYCNGQQMAMQFLPSNWWRAYRQVEISVNGKIYIQGYASGDAYTCLVDTLRQKLNIISNTARVRTELEKMFREGPGRVRAGD
eukprot:4233384-Karenia_brevis.AAC.1